MRIFAYTAKLTLFILLLAIATPSIAFNQVKSGSTATPFSVTEVVDAINVARFEEGLPSLSSSTKLSLAAENKAAHMVNYNYFDHYLSNAPDGLATPWDFIKDAEYRYVYAGENLAADFKDADKMIDVMLNSPAHRNNLLNPNFTDVGIGIVLGEKDDHRSWMVVQMFGKTTY